MIVKIQYFILAMLTVSIGYSQEMKKNLSVVIPEPASLVFHEGYFQLGEQIQVSYASGESEVAARLFADFLQEQIRVPVIVTQQRKKTPGTIWFNIKDSSKKESYSIKTTAKAVEVQGDDAGLFYALQTLQQLVESAENKFVIPSLTIEDYPRFPHRGMMIDVGRYFYSVDYLKKFIEVMATYKLNRFHLHLTEDAGWRMEIKAFPKLTEIGASRNGTQIAHHHLDHISSPHQGYYTQEELKDLVQYAAERHIVIVPEIDMPGHTMAAIAAYPHLSCTGRQVEVPEHWGIKEDILCAGKDSVYSFLEQVLTEVMHVFPSEYIHIGGDEAPKSQWKSCPLCQEKIKNDGLKNEEGLQSYFIKRIEEFVNAKGRKIIGWDEILEGGLAPNATVMSWRGEEGGIVAAKQGNQVIMTPLQNLYFDYAESHEWEPIAMGYELSLRRVYDYDPVPQILSEEEKKLVIGLQGNLWSEFIHNENKMDYRAWPRGLAVAETGWSPKERKDFRSFRQRLSYHLGSQTMKSSYFRIPEPWDLSYVKKISEGQYGLTLVSPVQGARLFYTFEDAYPHTLYEGAILLDGKARESNRIRCRVELPDGRTVVYTKMVPEIALVD